MNSMTAFGRGEATNGVVTVVVELRSVNHRFRDLNLKLPREYNALEPRVTNVLRERFDRGRIDCTVRRIGPEGPNTVSPDLRLAAAYARAAQAVAQRLQLDEKVDLAWLLGQPGVLAITEVELDPTHEWELLEPALTGAAEHLADMRAREGRALRKDLQQHIGEMLRYLGEMRASSSGVVEALRRRFDERLRALVGEQFDPVRLAQEAALLADKADVSEELARLESHLDQFRELLAGQEPAGRKMEFLIQEMHREVNTVGSKAIGENASRIVVQMKSALEKLREQAANVE
ncbi:MAG: YicC/YloC family endoribonuclease [Pseudomonadota bacterium]